MSNDRLWATGYGAEPRKAEGNDWVRKQRLKEYRVAARRERRNRKSDEKKQRKLNATILRRMTRNPEKYNRNSERNRLRDIYAERQNIWVEAIRQAQRLAAEHDPTGASFNLSPVVKQEDGTVISLESWRKREEKAKPQPSEERHIDRENKPGDSRNSFSSDCSQTITQNGVDSGCIKQIKTENPCWMPKNISKTQQKKRAALEPRTPPRKPTMPQDVSIPKGEENWLALWDLSDDQLERRVIKNKKRKVLERKALRVKQQAGKVARRIARDEKRSVYGAMKLTWKMMKDEQAREKTKLKAIEDREFKNIAVDITHKERMKALACCASLGFTLANTFGLDESDKLSIRGLDVKYDPNLKSNRSNFGNIPIEYNLKQITNGNQGIDTQTEEFISLDVGEVQEVESFICNHKARHKLRRAIEDAHERKESLVRQKALDYYTERDCEPPAVLKTSSRPLKMEGQRMLENGELENAKQERVRVRMDLVGYNKSARVLRKKAKQIAIEAGLRRHAELNGKLP